MHGFLLPKVRQDQALKRGRGDLREWVDTPSNAPDWTQRQPIRARAQIFLKNPLPTTWDWLKVSLFWGEQPGR
jgi:hypothetical protein